MVIVILARCSLVLVEKLLDALGLTKLPEETTVSLLHALPLHFLQPVLQHALLLHLRLERGLHDIGLDPFASIFRLSTFVNKLLGEDLIARHERLAKVLVLDELDGTELHGEVR